MELRLLLAVLLMGVVLFVSNYFAPPLPPPDASKDKAAEVAKEVPAAEAPAPAAPILATAEMPGAIHADQEEAITVETDLYKVVFLNRGAVVRSWVLKAYKDSRQQPLELVNGRTLALTGKQALPSPFALTFKSQPSNDPNDDLYRVQRSGEGDLTITFEFSDGRTSAKKVFEFSKNSYLVMLNTQVLENGVAIPHSLVWRGGFGDSTVLNPAPDTHTVFFDVPANKLNKKAHSPRPPTRKSTRAGRKQQGDRRGGSGNGPRRASWR